MYPCVLPGSKPVQPRAPGSPAGLHAPIMFQQQIDDTAELEKKKWTWHGTHQATTKYAAPDASFFPEEAERPAHECYCLSSLCAW